MTEYETYPILNNNALLMRAIQQKSADVSCHSDFDPYQVLLKRKKQQDSGELPPIKDIDPDDLYELQQFCQKHGIIGFNCGKMNPKAALQILKSRMGIKENPVSNTNQKSILLG